MGEASQERGTVTAELVLTLPAVMLVLGISLAGMSIQLMRMDMVSNASEIARAVARDEPLEEVDRLVQELGEAVVFELQESDGFVCVVLKSEMNFFEIELSDLELVESHCAKAQGQ